MPSQWSHLLHGPDGSHHMPRVFKRQRHRTSESCFSNPGFAGHAKSAVQAPQAPSLNTKNLLPFSGLFTFTGEIDEHDALHGAASG